MFDIFLEAVLVDARELFEFVLMPPLDRILWPTVRGTKLKSRVIREDVIAFMTRVAFKPKIDS